VVFALDGNPIIPPDRDDIDLVGISTDNPLDPLPSLCGVAVGLENSFNHFFEFVSKFMAVNGWDWCGRRFG
jgi:hypothetical protein